LDASEFTLCQLTKAEDHRRSDDDRAKKADDDLIAAAFRAKADALKIEALAKRRLADEYDAAQGRGEVQKAGGDGRRRQPFPQRNPRSPHDPRCRKARPGRRSPDGRSGRR